MSMKHKLAVIEYVKSEYRMKILFDFEMPVAALILQLQKLQEEHPDVTLFFNHEQEDYDDRYVYYLKSSRMETDEETEERIKKTKEYNKREKVNRRGQLERQIANAQEALAKLK